MDRDADRHHHLRPDQRGHRAGQAVALVALLLLALVAAAPAEAASSTASAKKRPGCAKRGSHTIDSNRQARVYSVRNRDGGRDLYGCLRADGRPQLLAHGFDDGFTSSNSYSRVRLSGHFVTWRETSTDDSCKADCPPGYDGTTSARYTRDLKRRKTVQHSAPAS